MLPNGDVLVAETNAPPKPEDGKGIKGWLMKQVMKRAGAGTPSANRITLLRDVDGDGSAATRAVFLENLNSPFGMALVGNDFYVANTDAHRPLPVRRRARRRIDAAPTDGRDLPGGPINHHWTKNVIASRDGTQLYATVGSNSNVGENGMAAEEGRAAIWEIDRADRRAAHLRDAACATRTAWPGSRRPARSGPSVNERDELGSDLVPDYLTSVHDGAFYGWPYSYYGQHVDDRVQPQRPDLVAKADRARLRARPAHRVARPRLVGGLDAAGAVRGEGMFVGQHGSWNRKPHSGYSVIFVPFANGKPSGAPIDVLTGFLERRRRGARAARSASRSTRRGALLVADDVGNVVWRVTAAGR